DQLRVDVAAGEGGSAVDQADGRGGGGGRVREASREVGEEVAGIRVEEPLLGAGRKAGAIAKPGRESLEDIGEGAAGAGGGGGESGRQSGQRPGRGGGREQGACALADGLQRPLSAVAGQEPEGAADGTLRESRDAGGVGLG